MSTSLAALFAVVCLGAVVALVRRARPEGSLGLQVGLPLGYAALLAALLWLVAMVDLTGVFVGIALVAISAIAASGGRPHLVTAMDRDIDLELARLRAERAAAASQTDAASQADADEPVVEQVTGRPGAAPDPERQALAQRIRRMWFTFLVMAGVGVLTVVFTFGP